MRKLLARLEAELDLWREEPARRLALRNEVVRPWRARQFASFGAKSIVDRPAWLYGTHLVSVGAGVVFLEGAWLAVERVAWSRPEPVLRIGDRVVARTGCTISAAESIQIEDHVGIGGGVTIIDSKHTWAPGKPNVMDGPIEAAPVRIGKGTWLADGAVVAAGADIGEQCAIGPNTVVSSRVADFSVVIGNPGRVVGSTRV